MLPFRLLSVFVVAFSAGFLACGGAVEAPSPEGTTPPPSGGTPSPGTPSNPPPISATSSPTPANPPSTPPKPPSTPVDAWSTQAGGCGDFFVVVPNVGNTKVLTISADRTSLGLVHAGDSVTVDLASHFANVEVAVHDYQTPINGELPFCTDVISGNIPKPLEWTVLAGKVTFTLATAPKSPGEMYGVNVRLQGFKMQSPSGTWVEQTADATWVNVNVGWFAG